MVMRVQRGNHVQRMQAIRRGTCHRRAIPCFTDLQQKRPKQRKIAIAVENDELPLLDHRWLISCVMVNGLRTEDPEKERHYQQDAYCNRPC